ncbi:hypothetical protein [Streptomyces sp. NPDC055036]
MTSKTQAPVLNGVNWRKRASERPGQYKYNVGMLKPEETTRRVIPNADDASGNADRASKILL